jgi:hypothetical protein
MQMFLYCTVLLDKLAALSWQIDGTAYAEEEDELPNVE